MEPPKSSSGLKTRLLSGLVLGPAILALVWMGGWPFYALCLTALILALMEWRAIVAVLPNARGYLFGGAAYLTFCILCFALLDTQVPAPLYLMLTIWASDIGAYFAGSMIGGPKLAPSISPKKTWAGVFGGAVASGLVFFALNHFIWAIFAPPALVFAIGAAMTFVGQAGDLLESHFKRKAGVKDSGNLIPGHGGILDRIDALLLASPVFLILVKVIGL